MDTRHFYGSLKHTNVIPGDGSYSDDGSLDNSDSDGEYLPPNTKNREDDIISDSEDEASEREAEYFSDSSATETDDEKPSTSNKRPKKQKGKSTKKQKVAKQNTKATEKQKVRAKREKEVKVTWRELKLKEFDEELYKFLDTTNLPESMDAMHDPSDFFPFLFLDELLDTIVDESNLKAIQDHINKPLKLTKLELQQFIGITMFMSLVKLPSTRLYWSTSLGQPQVHDIMTCNRWENIKRHLHFNDDTKFIPQGLHGHDKLFKVRPLIEAIRKQLLLVPKEEYLAVDEQIIPTKARHTLKQYNPKKPKKWGYKNLVLCGSSGFSYDFDIFAGEQSNIVPEGAPNIGASGNIVIKLTDSVPRHKNYKIFFDNWFNSIKLQVYLSKIGLLSLGTARTNRVTDSTMPSEKEFKKRVMAVWQKG